MSNERWYSITTPDQLVEAVLEGLRVECVRGSDVRTAELLHGRIFLKAGNMIKNDVAMTDTIKLRMWFNELSQYQNWRVLDVAGRMPYRTLPV